jgi:hypothetical protein
MKHINEYNSFISNDEVDNINDLFFINFEDYKLIEIKSVRSWSLRDDIFRSKDYNDNKEDKNVIFYSIISEGDSIFLCINFDYAIKYMIDRLIPLFYKRISKFGFTKFGDKTSCSANGSRVSYFYRNVYNIEIKRIVKKDKKLK